MKKLCFLLLLSLCGTGSLLAQTIDSMRYQLDQVFAHVDKSQRNALVFERVVQEVASWKSISQTQFGLTPEANVVMGMSMGGLIARYGLAQMTKNTFPFGPPDTRLLVLHDSHLLHIEAGGVVVERRRLQNTH